MNNILGGEVGRGRERDRDTETDRYRDGDRDTEAEPGGVEGKGQEEGCARLCRDPGP